MLVVIIVVECRIDRRADDALRLEFLQRCNVGFKIDDCDALKATLAFRDRVEMQELSFPYPEFGCTKSACFTP